MFFSWGLKKGIWAMPFSCLCESAERFSGKSGVWQDLARNRCGAGFGPASRPCCPLCWLLAALTCGLGRCQHWFCSFGLSTSLVLSFFCSLCKVGFYFHKKPKKNRKILESENSICFCVVFWSFVWSATFVFILWFFKFCLKPIEINQGSQAFSD